MVFKIYSIRWLYRKQEATILQKCLFKTDEKTVPWIKQKFRNATFGFVQLDGLINERGFMNDDSGAITDESCDPVPLPWWQRKRWRCVKHGCILLHSFYPVFLSAFSKFLLDFSLHREEVERKVFSAIEKLFFFDFSCCVFALTNVNVE